MIKFSATFGNIVLTVKASPYQGATDTLPLSSEDREDLEEGSAGIYQVHIEAYEAERPSFTIEFIEPFVVVGLYSDDEEVSHEESMMEEIGFLIEQLMLPKIEHHFELENQATPSTPPWGKK